MPATAPVSGRLTTADDPERTLPWADPRDIAAARLLNDTWHGRAAQGVHGPEDLSWRRGAEILTAALDRDIRLRVAPDDDVRQRPAAAGLPPGAVAGIAGMTAGTRALPPEQPRDAITTTPTPLAGWAHAHLRPCSPHTAPKPHQGPGRADSCRCDTSPASGR